MPAPSKLRSPSVAEDRPASRLFAQVTDVMASSRLDFRFQAKGRSMFPTIQDGDILHVHPADPYSIEIGEIVLFRDGEGFKAHRVIQTKHDLFITRGDSSMQADDPVRPEQIVGKVISKECATTRQIVYLEGVRPRLRFLANEARKRIPASLRSAARFLIFVCSGSKP
jgi:signal peptidase I